MSEIERIELELFQHVETNKAYMVSETGSKKDGIWLPKSQVEVEQLDPTGNPDLILVTIPEWLAKEKGLI